MSKQEARMEGDHLQKLNFHYQPRGQSGFGALEIVSWPLEPNIPSTPSFRKGSKALGPMSLIYWYVKDP